MAGRTNQELVVKIPVFAVCLLPFGWLLADTFLQRLGANPIETLHFRTGDWTLRFLCLTLALHPLKTLSGQAWPLRFRRMIGLFTFFYATLHMLVYVALDQSFSWAQIRDEIPETPYVVVGLSAWVLLLPLALTSTKNMQRRLGRNWKKLHRLIYVSAVLALWHYFWLVKEDYGEPLFYSVLVLLLLGFRLAQAFRKLGWASVLFFLNVTRW